MKEYHKIQSVWKRDPATNNRTFIEGAWSIPEFGYLANNEWVFTEKVDGTNIRVVCQPYQEEGAAYGITFGGKTEAASIPAALVQRLELRFHIEHQRRRIAEIFPDGACLYGEGYGAKIQKGGGNYRPDQDFVLFDVKVGGFWLKREDVADVAQKLGLEVVPIIGFGTLNEMIERTRGGFYSIWGPFKAEGIVARPMVELFARNGERIITKVKHKDFVK